MSSSPATSSAGTPTAAGHDSVAVIDLRRGLAAVRRQRWTMSAAGLLTFALLAAVLLSLPKSYTATGSVQVITHEKNTADILPEAQQAGDSALSESSRVETEMEVLHSTPLAREALRHIPPEVKVKRESPFSGVAHFLKSLVPRKTSAVPTTPQAEREAAVQDLLKGLKVARVGQSYVINVAYTADSPERAALIANTFIDVYQASKLQANISSNVEANGSLNATLANLGAQVAQADAAVARYKAAYGLEQAGASTVAEQNIGLIAQQLVTVQAQSTEATARYRTAESQIAAGGNGGDVGDVLASPVVSTLRAQRSQVSQTLTDLRARHGPRHPDVMRATDQLADLDAQIQAETRRIISNLKAQAEISQRRTAALQGDLGRAKGTLAAQEAASVGLADLVRRQEGARTAYQDYLNRYKRTSSQPTVSDNDTRVVARAVADPHPSSLPPLKAFALAAAGGFLGALGALGLGEALQTGVDDAEDLERQLGVRALPVIPDLRSAVRGRPQWPAPTDYVVHRPLSSFAECFRTLRTSVLAGRDGQAAQVVAITSVLPGEGKTTTCVCFARLAASGGLRTVVVDCDLRRRSLDGIIGQRSKRGWMDVVDEGGDLTSVLVADQVGGCQLLPVGGAQQAHRNIFTSPAMGRLLDELRSRFDLVLLDSPPVLALADAREIARKADTAVLLAKWRTTPRKAVDEAIRDLEEVGAKLAGVALVQVDLRKKQAGGAQGVGRGYYKHYGGYFTD